jgi:hypothetical protein
MRPVRRAAVTGLFALWLAPLPALAGGQSSGSNATCPNGHCTRLESLTIADRSHCRGRLGEGHRADERPRRDRDDDED